MQALGTLYVDVGDSSNGIQYLRFAEDAFTGDDLFNLSLENNYGAAYQGMERYADSEQHFVAALQIAERLNLRAYAIQIRLNLAMSAIFQNHLTAASSALAGLGPFKDLSETQQRELYRLRALMNLKAGHLIEAERLIELALEGADPQDSPFEFRNSHFVAYEIYRAQNKTGLALIQLEAVRRLNSASEQLLASNRAALLAAQFQFAAQDMRITQLKADKLERDVAFERSRAQFQQTVTVIIVIGALLTLGLLSGLLVVAMRARDRAQRDGAELAVVNERLERALAAKTEFLASTSHEIRTPLNGILGMTQIMMADSNLPAITRTQVELVHDAGTTMRALVDDILDVAKIEHGGFVINPRPTDVGALASRVTRLFEAQAESRGIALTCDAELPAGEIILDPDRMTQVLFNLVGNALKFTHEGRIAVTLEHRQSTGSATLVLTVADSGIGIAPEWQEAVFDMFRQVDQARSRNYGGTGLGLAICRQLARAMGGDIALESAEGEGSRFIVSLPWVPAESGTVVAFPGAAKGADTPPGLTQVLVVAADPLRAAMLATIARRANHDVIMPDRPDRVAAMEGHRPVKLLVDAQAIDQAKNFADALPCAIGAMIIAGDVPAGTDLSMFPHDCVTIVAFARNVIIDALVADDSACVSSVGDKRLRDQRVTANGHRQPRAGSNGLPR